MDNIPQPYSPMPAEQKRFDFRSVALLILILAFLAGVGYFTYKYLSENKISDLKTNGKLLETTYTSVEINWNLSINKQHPYQIHSVYVVPDTETIYYFKSKNLWSNPERFVPKMIKVYVDPDNYKNYWMDTSFLEPTK